MRSLLRIIIGIGFIFLGLIGFLLPILPGWVFFFLGLVLVSPTHGKNIVDYLKKRFKKI